MVVSTISSVIVLFHMLTEGEREKRGRSIREKGQRTTFYIFLLTKVTKVTFKISKHNIACTVTHKYTTIYIINNIAIIALPNLATCDAHLHN